MSQLYKIDSSRTNCWKTIKDKLFLYLIFVITCKSISRYLIRKRYRAIWNFYRYLKLRALLYSKTLARRERYNITIIFSLKVLILNNIKNYISLIKTKIFTKRQRCKNSLKIFSNFFENWKKKNLLLNRSKFML